MISKITMFGFKSGAGYQFDRREEKRFERYLIRAEKAAENKKKEELDNSQQQSQKRFDKRI